MSTPSTNNQDNPAGPVQVSRNLWALVSAAAAGQLAPLRPRAWAVYLAVESCREAGQPFRTMQDLAGVIGCTRASVAAGFRDLCAMGIYSHWEPGRGPESAGTDPGAFIKGKSDGYAHGAPTASRRAKLTQ